MTTSSIASAPTASRRRGRITQVLAGGALAGVVIAALIQLISPLLRPDADLIRGALSQYAVGPWGWLNGLSFIAVGGAAAAVALALLGAGLRSPWLPIGAFCLAVAALGSVATAFFPMGSSGPTTALGDAHQTAATLAAVFLLAAILFLALAFGSDPRWRSLCLPAWLLFVLGTVAAMATQLAMQRPEFGLPFGIIHRVLTASLLLWLGLVALRLWRGGNDAIRSASAP